MTDLADDLRALVEDLEREAEKECHPHSVLRGLPWDGQRMVYASAATRLRALLAKHEGAGRRCTHPRGCTHCGWCGFKAGPQ